MWNMFKKTNFVRHLKVHTGRSNVLTCKECGKTFNRTDHFCTHVNRFHGETTKHECGDCKKTCSQKWYLKEHMIFHTGAPRKQCKYCEKDSSSKTNLHRHVKKCHTTPKMIENTQGFIMLERSPERNSVQHLKPKSKYFNCETCDDKSKRKYNLELHVKNKHERPPNKVGRKRKLPSQWSDGTKKEYAKKLKRSFTQKVKDLEL